MQTTDWKDTYLQEIAQARRAQTAGNAGMARVCARRAVGVLIGEYLQQQGAPQGTPSAYERIKVFQALPNIDPQTQQVVDHFLLRVRHDHSLPGDPDLIAEAEWLLTRLFPEE